MIKITKVATICNLGNNLDEIFHNILSAKLTEFKISSPLPQINLVSPNTKVEKMKYVMCNAFGFGGTNAVMVMGK